VVKTFEAQHRPGPAFDAAMILFDHVIEVLTIAQERIGRDYLVFAELRNRPMRGLVAVQGNLLGRAVVDNILA
jgi:hypothetical protein